MAAREARKVDQGEQLSAAIERLRVELYGHLVELTKVEVAKTPGVPAGVVRNLLIRHDDCLCRSVGALLKQSPTIEGEPQ
jgi:hypothetical protein